MQRLTDTVLFSIETFTRCQLCGYEGDDICEFSFWKECDEHDEPEPYNVLITCKQDACSQKIEQHERLYIQLAWGNGDPGHLILLCGDCPHRSVVHCTHPDLKDNGGNGLLLAMANDPINRAVVCYHTDDNEYGLKCCRPKPPFIACAGLPEGHYRHFVEEKSKVS